MNEVKLNYLHICENAFFSEDKKLNIIGIFDAISTSQVPAMHPSFSIAFNFSGYSADKIFELHITSPSGEVIAKAPVKLNQNVPFGKAANFVINIVGLVFKEKGKNVIRLMCNGNIANTDSQEYFLVIN